MTATEERLAAARHARACGEMDDRAAATIAAMTATRRRLAATTPPALPLAARHAPGRIERRDGNDLVVTGGGRESRLCGFYTAPADRRAKLRAALESPPSGRGGWGGRLEYR